MNKKSNINKNGLAALKTVENFLQEIGWNPQKTDIEEVLRVDFKDEKIPVSFALFDIRVQYERFICYFYFKNNTQPENNYHVIEFITRANFGLVIGNFEFDIDNGYVRFKSSLDFTQLELNDTLLQNTIKSAMDSVEEYAEVLEEVIQGKKDAATAIREVENFMQNNGNE